jgi:hypothetical protein
MRPSAATSTLGSGSSRMTPGKWCRTLLIVTEPLHVAPPSVDRYARIADPNK